MNAHCMMKMLVVAGALIAGSTVRADDIGIDGCWSGTLTMTGKSVAMSGHIQNHGGTREGSFDVPAIASYGKIFETIDVKGSAVTMQGGKGRNRISVIAEFHGDTITGNWRIGPMSGEIQLNRCDLPVPPRTIREEVTFSNGKIRLSGTLIMPLGSGPFPVIVWTHGSGNITRTNRIYSRWVNLLAREGVASLIYDKRGYGGSSGVESEATLHDLAADLLVGVAFVKSRSKIDPKRIGVSGLSQGGWIGPLAASQSNDVGFVIVESASGMTASEQDLFLQANRLRNQHRPEPEIATIIALRDKLFHYYRTGEGKDRLMSELKSSASKPWYDRESFPKPPFDLNREKHAFPMSRFELDVVAIWESVRVPVLAVWGGRDRLVPAEKSRNIIAAALERAGNTDTHLQIFPEAIHTLDLGKSADDPWSRIRIAPAWPRLLSDWVKRHVTNEH